MPGAVAAGSVYYLKLTGLTVGGWMLARSAAVATVWSMWSQVYSKSGLYKLASWFMSRGRALSPSEQGAWTRSRTPLVPAPKRLRDLMKDRKP